MDKEEILLKEYEMCLQNNNSHASRYWLIFGIFMPINTALLGAIGYSIISNVSSPSGNAKFIILGLGLGMVVILISLKLWLKRENFIISVSHERMREIEIELGMWRSLMFQGIDWWGQLCNKRNIRKYYDKLSNEEQDTTIWNELYKKLKENISQQYHERLLEREDRLIEQCKRYPPKYFPQLFSKYEFPARRYANLIFYVLIVLWLFFIIMAFINSSNTPLN